TSTGVPMIGCDCEICTSDNPKNRRTRSSALIRTGGEGGEGGTGGGNILIDTSTDLRAQSLAAGMERVDAVLFTHHHADHIHGIDELRAFNFIQKQAIPCYGSERTIERVRGLFEYIFTDTSYDGWKPQLETEVADVSFTLFGVEVVPVEVRHGQALILGFRVGDVAYLTDCSAIPPSSMELLDGLELLVLGALRQSPHPSHFSIDEAVDAAREIAPRRTVLTHLSHNVDYEKDGAALPPGVELAYDGMEIEI
ncbi:MAG: MBL fold metallo-hydrolase, partial [Thermodesulfobacteriota bacterium]